MSKVLTDQIEKRTGGTAMDVPAAGKWPTANIADDAIDSAQIAANAVGNSEMADDAVGVAELSATGTASATTFLRGDNSWTAVDTSGIQANADDIALLAFRVAANGSFGRYNLVDQSVDAFEDATGIDASASTGETRDATGKYYSGAVSPSGGIDFRYLRQYITSADYHDPNAGAHVFTIEDYNDVQTSPTSVYTNGAGLTLANTALNATGQWWYTSNTSNAQNGYGDWGEIKTGIDTFYIGKIRINGDPTQMKFDYSVDNSSWTVVDFSSATYAVGGGTDFTFSGGTNGGFITLSAFSTNGQMGYRKIMLNNSTPASYTDMTLVSNSTTAEAAPTKGDLVMTYSNGAGTATIGTDLTVEFSADNGSTWTDFGISASDVEGTTGGHTIISKHDVSLTSTSGTSMRYRIKTLNQSVSKQTRIQAVSLGWS